MTELDEKYLQILIERIGVSQNYLPKFGQGGEGITLAQFQTLYSSDPFYAWFGLDHPLMYAAHKASGGITSIYRQIGLGSEELFRQILQDHLELTTQQIQWSYEISSRTLKLDACIEPEYIINEVQRKMLLDWQQKIMGKLKLEPRVA
jgi:hypothetical protein